MTQSGHRRLPSIEVPMIDGTKKRSLGDSDLIHLDIVDTPRFWLARLESERNFSTATAALLTDFTGSGAGAKGDHIAGRDRDDRCRALASLVSSSEKFRLLQSKIRFSSVYTDLGALEVVADLVKEEARAMRESEERRQDAQRHLEKEKKAEERESAGKCKRDLWAKLREEVLHVAAVAGAITVDARPSERASSRLRSVVHATAATDVPAFIEVADRDDVCSCGDDESCPHFDATGWGRWKTLLRNGTSVQEMSALSGSEAQGVSVATEMARRAIQPKKMVRAARGA